MTITAFSKALIRLAAFAYLLAASPLFAQGPTDRTSAEWPVVRVQAPFIIRADFDLKPHETLLNELDQLHAELRQALRIPPAQERIEVYLLASESDYREMLRQHFPKVPVRRALYIKRKGPGLVLAYRNDDWEVDLRHECTHALLHSALPMVPLWLDEGLAEYYETPPADRAYRSPHLSAVRLRARLGFGVNVQDLERRTSIEQMGGAEYRNAWAWIHFTLHGDADARAELVAYLSAIANHAPPGRLSERIAARIPDARNRFLAHFKTWSE